MDDTVRYDPETEQVTDAVEARSQEAEDLVEDELAAAFSHAGGFQALAGAGADVECEFVTGAAGTGKTHMMRAAIEKDPKYGKLCATTGIAAINLGTVTINSVLGYFDTESLEEAFVSGSLERKLVELAVEGYKKLICDEISMQDKRQLDIIYQAMRLVNERILWRQDDDIQPLGLTLTGDFCQLPPVKADWAFNADCWAEFDKNTTRLTRMWRQSDPQFLEAINLIRSGKGAEGAGLMRELVEFRRNTAQDYNGTTIMATNDAVNNYNWLRHSRIAGRLITVQSERWGQQRPEWRAPAPRGQRGGGHIPYMLQLKVGAYVMVLANDTPNFSYVNGDCGTVEDFVGNVFMVKLVRNGKTVGIPKICRGYVQKHPPNEYFERWPEKSERDLRAEFANRPKDAQGRRQAWWDTEKRKWVLGEVYYYPLRLAYGTTVHKSQGLSLDNVQIDLNSNFIGTPSMVYVAISRARTPGGLQLIGTPELLAQKVKIDPAVRRWL